MKLCINCRYFHREFMDSDRFGKCELGPSPVTGAPDVFCSIERRNGELGCGPSGDKFKQKRTMLDRVLGRWPQ